MTHTRNWSFAFNPSKCTHTAVSSEHTHCEHAPGAVGSHCSSARGAIGGSVPCSRAPQSWYWRWRECCSFTIPTFNPCRTWDSNPQPLDYKSDSLTITPRLPHHWWLHHWFWLVMMCPCNAVIGHVLFLNWIVRAVCICLIKVMGQKRCEWIRLYFYTIASADSVQDLFFFCFNNLFHRN